MLRGTSALHLDTKGRLAIPSRYREELMRRCGGHLVVTLNNTKEKCLWMYPLDEWERVEEKVVGLPDFDPNHQKLKRFFIGHASDTSMDKSGRVLLPPTLREFAGVTKDLFLIGRGNKFELWDKALWIARRDQWLQEGVDMENVSVELEQLSL